jgi:hypothetical protein
MNEIEVPNKLMVTKQRLKEWGACADGRDWFKAKFPQGALFAEVYEALRGDRRYSDSDWLVEHVFKDLTTAECVRETCVITGADEKTIKANATTTGDRANSATTGYWANSATTGNWANSATTGNWANSATTGNWANSATTGNWANSATTGNWANSATTGNWANSATTGDRANSATTGDRANSATTGEGAVAAALGGNSKAKAGPKGAIVLVNRDKNGAIRHIRASKVGENGIKADVWYSLNDAGEFVECE